jgi:hypothetical protein
MRTLTNREKKLALITLGVISLGLVMKLWLLPVFKKYAGLQKEITAYQARLAENQNLISQAPGIRQAYEKLPASEKTKNIAGEAELAFILSELENLSRQAGTLIMEIRPLQSLEEEREHKLLIRLRLQGKISQILKFLYDLEISSQPLAVSEFNLTPSIGDNLEIEILISRMMGI